MTKQKILITGGAGYIGSHVVKALGEQGYDVLVFDNLSTGHADAVLHGKLIQADLSDTAMLAKALDEFKPAAVMHFAASIEVAESVREPLKYYRNNAANAVNLLDAMEKAGVRHFIFSSTAAVYGTPAVVPITETAPLAPINPYGRSKVFIEQVLTDQASMGRITYIALRYFNAAGADEGGRIGESHEPESHLIPLVLKAVRGTKNGIAIYGDDYPTPDGTCIRDYIHVNDLADVHIRALEHLLAGGDSGAFNCGYGKGYSVREIIGTAQKVTGADFPVTVEGRRAGDPPVLVADPSWLRTKLDWQPKYNNLEYIIRTAWEWERKRK
jgi:UDP-glucose 4-epimerase